MCNCLSKAFPQLADLSPPQLYQLLFGADQITGCLVLILQVGVHPLSEFSSSDFLLQTQLQIFDLVKLLKNEIVLRKRDSASADNGFY